MKITGTAVTFLNPNTDTDIIIPARFLKRTALDNFEPFAFFEKRYATTCICEPSIEKRDFIFQKKILNEECSLNHPHAKGANFLITWENFGCGSSREHAVYALKNYKVIIGSASEGKSAFADIFRDNCRQNLIWTPVISATDHHRLVEIYNKNISKGKVASSFDVEKMEIQLGGEVFKCSMPIEQVNYILNGKDPFEKASEEIKNSLKKITDWNLKNKEVLLTSPNSFRYL